MPASLAIDYSSKIVLLVKRSQRGSKAHTPRLEDYQGHQQTLYLLRTLRRILPPEIECFLPWQIGQCFVGGGVFPHSPVGFCLDAQALIGIILRDEPRNIQTGICTAGFRLVVRSRSTGCPGILDPLLSKVHSLPWNPPGLGPSPSAHGKTMSEQPWSDNPNAPKIPHHAYTTEKALLAGGFISSIFYGTPRIPPAYDPSIGALTLLEILLGMLVVLFFKCMAALLNPVHRKMEGIQWGLVSYTVATFSFATVGTAISLNIQSLAFIDNREFTGLNGTSLGPLAYRLAIHLTVLDAIPNLMFFFNNLLADGLLVGFLFGAISAPACPGV